MEHGIDQFFHERTACRRRVSILSASLSVFLLSLLGTALLPPFSRAIRESPFVRFGFEGPTRYVRLLRVEAVQGTDEDLVNVGTVVTEAASRGGGGGEPRPGRGSTGEAGSAHRPPGAGEAQENLVQRALSGRSGVPVFQSEELIIDHLVRPEYPEEARDRGIEGRVSVIAHVDTTGAVVETQVWVASGEPKLDQAAEVAVRQCRFKPYRVGGEVREVFAVFRFSFTLY
jgi:TonB family protein